MPERLRRPVLVVLSVAVVAIALRQGTSDTGELTLGESVMVDWPALEIGPAQPTSIRQWWPARIVPAQRFLIKAPSESEVLETHLALGRTFRHGELLIKLYDRELLAKYGETQRRIERLRFKRVSAPVDVLRAQQAERRLRTELSRLRNEVSTHRSLFDQGLIPKLELTQLEQRSQDALDQHLAAQQELGVAVASARLARLEMQGELVEMEALRDSQAARVAALEVRAPFTGNVTWVGPAGASPVKAGADLGVLESADRVEAELRLVRSPDVEQVFAVGAPMHVALQSVSLDAPASEEPQWIAGSAIGNDGQLRATVSALAGTSMGDDVTRAAEEAALIAVRIAIDDADWSALAPQARAQWLSSSIAGVWVVRQVPVVRVPLAAVLTEKGRSYVYVRDRDGLRPVWSRREVDGSPDGNGRFAIIAGVTSGEHVAVPK